MRVSWEKRADISKPDGLPCDRLSVAAVSTWLTERVDPQFASLAARFLFVLGLAVGVVILLPNDRRDVPIPPNGGELSPSLYRQGTAVPTLPPQMTVQYHRPLLAAPSAGDSGTLQRFALSEPQHLCDAIAADGPAAVWTESEVFPGEWECLSQESGPADQTGGSRIFAMARGRDREHVQLVRFKLSVPTTTEAQAAADALRQRVEDLLQSLHWTFPERLANPLRRLQPITVEDSGTRFRLMREVSDGQRYNLLISFPDARTFVRNMQEGTFAAR